MMIYYIGIDISKYKHDFCIISNTGEVIVENLFLKTTKRISRTIGKVETL